MPAQHGHVRSPSRTIVRSSVAIHSLKGQERELELGDGNRDSRPQQVVVIPLQGIEVRTSAAGIAVAVVVADGTEVLAQRMNSGCIDIRWLAQQQVQVQSVLEVHVAQQGHLDSSSKQLLALQEQVLVLHRTEVPHMVVVPHDWVVLALAFHRPDLHSDQVCERWNGMVQEPLQMSQHVLEEERHMVRQRQQVLEQEKM